MDPSVFAEDGDSATPFVFSEDENTQMTQEDLHTRSDEEGHIDDDDEEEEVTAWGRLVVLDGNGGQHIDLIEDEYKIGRGVYLLCPSLRL